MTTKPNKKKRSYLMRFIRDVFEVDKWSFLERHFSDVSMRLLLLLPHICPNIL